MKAVTPVTNKKDQKIVEHYENCKRHAAVTVLEAVQCGVCLNERRGDFRHGDWELHLDTLEIPRTTAFRFMKVAASYSGKDKQLLEGKSLIDLYRELGLVKELEGGGARNGKNENAPAPQLFFSFDIFDGLLSVVKAQDTNPFIGLDKKQLEDTRTKIDETRELIEAALVQGN